MNLNFNNDIDLNAAQRAFEGTSFVPEKRGADYIVRYIKQLTSDYESLKGHCPPDMIKTLEIEFNRYHAKMKSLNIAYLQSHSRCMSTMITGGSNFPVASQNKKANSAASAMNKMSEYREKALKAINKKIHPELRPIMNGDNDAVKRLQTKIDKLEKLQVFMKAANKIVRSKPKNEITDDKIEALIKLKISEITAKKLFGLDYAGRAGFPSYSLTNNNVSISTMKKRLEKLKVTKEQKDFEIKNDETGISVEDCPSENRIKVFFPGKPDNDIRSGLKTHGFRWAPSQDGQPWQAYRNNNSIQHAKSFLA